MSNIERAAPKALEGRQQSIPKTAADIRRRRDLERSDAGHKARSGLEASIEIFKFDSTPRPEGG